MEKFKEVSLLKILKKLVLLILPIIMIAGMAISAVGEKSENDFSPVKNGAKKWRIGYCETTTFSNYAGILNGLIQGLEEYGWITNAKDLPYIEGQNDSSVMWKWLGRTNLGEYIEFPTDAYYSLDAMKTIDGVSPEDQIINRMNTKKDIDIMIVMGTKAGTLLANDKHNVPIFVFSASNAYGSGIVKNIDYSTSDHIWAHMDTARFKRQLQVFNDIFKFKKLGIVYENSELGRSYSALSDIELMAKERGFTIEREFVNEPKDVHDMDRYRKDMKSAYSKLSDCVDAFYITIGSIDTKWLADLLTPFYEKKIPVFSQLGVDEVQHGAMMSITLFDFQNMGRFGADTIIKKLSGIEVRKLPQVYENTPQILLNLEAANKVGYKPTFDIMLVADKVFKKIEK